METVNSAISYPFSGFLDMISPIMNKKTGISNYTLPSSNIGD